MMQFVVIVVIFGENVNIIFIVYEHYQIIKRNSHMFSHVPYVVTLPSFNFSSVLFSRTISTSTNGLLIWFVRSKQNAASSDLESYSSLDLRLNDYSRLFNSQNSRQVLNQLQVSSKLKVSEMCLACTWILTCVVAWLCFEIWFFWLPSEVFVVIDGNSYLNFGIISKNWKCSYLLCLLNGYAADRVKQVELKSSLLEVESVQDESCH